MPFIIFTLNVNSCIHWKRLFAEKHQLHVHSLFAILSRIKSDKGHLVCWLFLIEHEGIKSCTGRGFCCASVPIFFIVSKKILPSPFITRLSFLNWWGDAEDGAAFNVLWLISFSSFTSMISSIFVFSSSSSEELGLRGGAAGMTRSGLLENSSRRMWMGETVTSQLVMPKSRRWALAWLDRPARVSKPALQNSQCIKLNVSGSKLATVERRSSICNFKHITDSLDQSNDFFLNSLLKFSSFLLVTLAR